MGYSKTWQPRNWRYFAACLLLGFVWAAQGANAQQIKIVGIGAASCPEFLREIASNTSVERDYFAWVQGYMSGLLIRAPAGKDEGLDLTPAHFPLLKQAAFLSAYCAAHADEYFTDAANELYRTLRAPPG